MSNEQEAAEHWRRLLGPYGGADLRRSVIQILTLAPPYFLCWYAAYRALSVSYWLTLALAVPAAAFLTRLFLIQHDCGYGSYFKSQKVADTVGFWIGILTPESPPPQPIPFAEVKGSKVIAQALTLGEALLGP